MSSLSKVKMSSLPVWQTGFAKLYGKGGQDERGDYLDEQKGIKTLGNNS